MGGWGKTGNQLETWDSEKSLIGGRGGTREQVFVPMIPHWPPPRNPWKTWHRFA